MGLRRAKGQLFFPQNAEFFRKIVAEW